MVRGRPRKSSNPPSIEKEEEEDEQPKQEDEEEEEEEQETATPRGRARGQRGSSTGGGGGAAAVDNEDTEDEDEVPKKRGRPSRAASKRRAATSDDDGDDDSDADGGAAAKRKKRGGGAAAKKRASSANWFCQSAVESEFHFTQAEDEPFVAQTQASQDTLRPQDEKTFDSLNDNERDAAVADAVRYMLLRGSRREPIVKKNLNDEVAKKYGKGMAKPIAKAAAEYLKRTFGYSLVTPPYSKFPSATAQDSLYLITSLRTPTLRHDINSYGKDVGLRGLIMVIVGLIYCAANKISERELFSQLQEVEEGLQVKEKPGGQEGEFLIWGEIEGIGDIGQALERLKKEQYLVRERQSIDDNAFEFNYRLGARTYVEIGRRQILKFLAEAQGQEVDRALMKELENDERHDLVSEDEGEAE